MASRRTFLASGVAIVSGGCLGGFGEEPYYTVEARSVALDESALTPSLQVMDDSISDDSPAKIEYQLQNRSLQSIEFSTRPDPSRLLGVGYSTENEAVLSRPDNTGRSISEGSGPCWRAETMVTLEDQMHYIWSIYPWIPRSREYHLAAPSSGDCLSPGTYRFETAYVINDSGMDDFEWIFEFEVREA